MTITTLAAITKAVPMILVSVTESPSMAIPSTTLIIGSKALSIEAFVLPMMNTLC